MYNPSYKQYEEILKTAKQTKKIMDFSEAITEEEFIILRHDVEFSLTKAAEIAKIEASNGVQSTFFVQVRNNLYNTFSPSNAKIIGEIVRLGHRIGLHYIRGDENEIPKQIKMLGNFFNIPVDRFSAHRPDPKTNYHTISFPGLINAYGKQFFERTQTPETAEIKYISDSNHKWNYGEPTADTFKNNKKIQLLTHPFSWSENGEDVVKTFNGLLKDHIKNAYETYTDEFIAFSTFEERVKP